MSTVYCDDRVPSSEQAVELYTSIGWSSAERPEALMGALRGSHALITAWKGEHLVGLANAISDGHLVVYFPHLLVHPDFQKQGIGSELMRRLVERYRDFHQLTILSDGKATRFYENVGFSRGGSTVPMWIYDGRDHD